MKNTTKTPTKKAKKTNAKAVSHNDIHKRTMQDVKTATLITSGLANMFVLVGWMVLQTTSKYNDQIVDLIFR